MSAGGIELPVSANEERVTLIVGEVIIPFRIDELRFARKTKAIAACHKRGLVSIYDREWRIVDEREGAGAVGVATHDRDVPFVVPQRPDHLTPSVELIFLGINSTRVHRERPCASDSLNFSPSLRVPRRTQIKTTVAVAHSRRAGAREGVARLVTQLRGLAHQACGEYF